MSNDEVQEKIKQAKRGDNNAWNALWNNYIEYVKYRVNYYLRGLNKDDAWKKQIKEDLIQAGWIGFCDAMRKYDPVVGNKFLTYAGVAIDREIIKERTRQLNTLGIAKLPENKEIKVYTSRFERVDFEEEDIQEKSYQEENEEKNPIVHEVSDKGKYSAERRALQLLEILKMVTDEEHFISKEMLGRLLKEYREAKYQNDTKLESDNTLTGTMEQILLELNPETYSVDNEDKYRIKYLGYEEDRLKMKRKNNAGKKSPSITDFYYVHIFSNEELDRLMATISFSELFSNEEKERLISKLVSTASEYYRTPFWNDYDKTVHFNPVAVHGRFTGRNVNCRSQLSENMKLIQYAINNMVQIRFRFNRYNDAHEMEPVSNYVHTISPYHLVVYHDNFYCIGLKDDDNRIWHYRVDLMSDLEYVSDERGKPVPIKVIEFSGLPICNALWDPEKYMSEHLYMAYDEPREILIKIKNTDYTILHDWFGNHYEKTNKECDEGYDIVKVKTSPSMIVHWAMQYAGKVEVLDKEVRKKIVEQINAMNNIYKA